MTVCEVAESETRDAGKAIAASMRKGDCNRHERTYLAEECDATELRYSSRNYFCPARPCVTKDWPRKPTQVSP